MIEIHGLVHHGHLIIGLRENRKPIVFTIKYRGVQLYELIIEF